MDHRLLVRSGPRSENRSGGRGDGSGSGDEDVTRAVHGLDLVLDVVVHDHARVHVLGVVVEVPRRAPEVRLHQMRGEDELEPVLLVHGPAAVLDQLAQHPALRVPHRQPRTDRAREAEQVELGPQPPVIPLLGLLEPIQVLVELGPRWPRCAVDPLQLVTVLVTTPVRTGASEQLDGRDAPGGREMGAATEVDEAVVLVGGDDLVTGHLRRVHRLDDLHLVLVVGEDLECLVPAEHDPLEGLVLLDDPVHPLFDALQVLRREGGVDTEVVVEAVLDGRADGESRPGELGEDGLGEDVSRGARRMQASSSG